MSDLLAIRDLLVRREKQTVLEIDQLRVQEGEVLAVIGPNGAGKSTLLLALARLLKPARGEITFGNQPLEEQNDLEYRRRAPAARPAPASAIARPGGFAPPNGARPMA